MDRDGCLGHYRSMNEPIAADHFRADGTLAVTWYCYGQERHYLVAPGERAHFGRSGPIQVGLQRTDETAQTEYPGDDTTIPGAAGFVEYRHDGRVEVTSLTVADRHRVNRYATPPMWEFLDLPHGHGVVLPVIELDESSPTSRYGVRCRVRLTGRRPQSYLDMIATEKRSVAWKPEDLEQMDRTASQLFDYTLDIRTLATGKVEAGRRTGTTTSAVFLEEELGQVLVAYFGPGPEDVALPFGLRNDSPLYEASTHRPATHNDVAEYLGVKPWRARERLGRILDAFDAEGLIKGPRQGRDTTQLIAEALEPHWKLIRRKSHDH